MGVSISVQTQDFDAGQEIEALGASGEDVGAVASFIGLVRGEGDAIKSMRLEHYPGMTEKALEEIAAAALQRWSLLGIRVIHRIGHLQTGDRIVLVVVSSRHRGDAFAACEFIMDYLKTRAPFWKKEASSQGEHWVEARDSDDDSAARW